MTTTTNPGIQPETILRDTVVLVPAAALVGALFGGWALGVGALAVGVTVLANLWVWARLSRAWLSAAAGEEGGPLVGLAMGFKALITVPLFVGLTYLFGPAAIGLGLGLPLMGGVLRLIYTVVSTDYSLPAEEVSS